LEDAELEGINYQGSRFDGATMPDGVAAFENKFPGVS
jgi:hypothetical protein